jgi:hypothetical protein
MNSPFDRDRNERTRVLWRDLFGPVSGVRSYTTETLSHPQERPMPFKVQLKHPLATEPAGLYRQKVSGLKTAQVFETFSEATRAMTAWLDYAGKERRALWTGQVVRVDVAAE